MIEPASDATAPSLPPPPSPGQVLLFRLRRLPRLTLAYYAVVVAVFLLAAWSRFVWPAEPFFDADGWGYLWGGLKKLTGGDYEHIFAREYAYPVMIETVLFVTGTFPAIACIRHILGLIGGGLMLGGCHLLVAMGRDRRHPPQLGVWSPCWTGLALTALYLLNFNTRFYEHSIRPEAIFPCFALASLFLNLLVIKGWRDGNARPWMLNVAGMNPALCVLVMLLRPSFRFSALAASIPFALLLLRREYSLVRRLTVLGLSLLAAAGLWLPEHLYSKDDRWSIRFVGERLFSVHCDLIARQIDADLTAHDTKPYDETWLRELGASVNAKLAESRRQENHPWRFIGFNADYIISSGTPLRQFFPDTRAGDEDMSTFCHRYYMRAALHQPVAMTRKVLTQIGFFYRTGTRLPPWNHFKKRGWNAMAPGKRGIAPLYKEAVEKLRPGPPFDGMVSASTAASRYLLSCQLLKHTRSRFFIFPPLMLIDRFCWVAHVVLVLVALGFCAAMHWLPEKGGPLQTLAATQWLVLAYPFGSCLATSIVFYVQDRYVDALDALVLVSTYANGVFVWWTFRALTRRTRDVTAGDDAAGPLPAGATT